MAPRLSLHIALISISFSDARIILALRLTTETICYQIETVEEIFSTKMLALAYLDNPIVGPALNTMAAAEVLRSEKDLLYEGLGEIVTVISKDGEAMAKVHKEFICAQSNYMAGLLVIQASMAVGRGNENGQELTLTLPFDEVPLDEEVVAKSLVYWFYRQHIHIPHVVRETSLDSLYGSYGLLCKLWVLAEKCHMKSLENDVVDGIWGLYLANEYLPYSIIDFVYKKTSNPLSAIRRLLVTIMEFGLSACELDELQDLLPKEFFVDLSRKQFDKPDEKYSNTMMRDFCKRFHEHDYVEEGEQFSECVGIKACD